LRRRLSIDRPSELIPAKAERAFFETEKTEAAFLES
jgi:hypothetical protein